MPKCQFFEEEDGEESKEEVFQSIEPLPDEYEIHSFSDNINGIGIGCYMSKYFTQKLKERKGYAMLGLSISQNYDLSSPDLLKQYFFDEACI